MNDSLDKLKQFGKVLGKGLMIELTPQIAESVVNQLFHEGKMDLVKVTDYIQHNRSLWDMLNPSQQQQVKNVVAKLGNLDFITPDLIVNAIKKDFPLVATLFINWDAAGYWLERQVNELKRNL